MKKKKKLIELTEGCIRILSKKAIDKNTNFKNFVQEKLEMLAKKMK